MIGGAVEQYVLPKRLDIRNLRLCLDNYTPTFLYIRVVGSLGGTEKVRERCEGRSLDFKKDRSGLRMIIDGNAVFHFPLKGYDKGFVLAYERFIQTGVHTGGMLHLSHGVDPYDPNLPEPTRSLLRIILDDHLMEIYFAGRVHLKFHSWLKEPHWKYWTIRKPPRESKKRNDLS